MLVSFTVGNFRSIGEQVTLSMVASRRCANHQGHLVALPGTDHALLRVAVLFGANAAGKSNVLRAMRYARDRIHSTSPTTPGPPPPFALDESFRDKPSTFEFRFLADERIFTYGMDLFGQNVDAEWLVVTVADRELPLFERDSAGRVTLATVAELDSLEDRRLADCLAHVAGAPLRRDQLTLRRIAELPADFAGRTLFRVVEWLRRGILEPGQGSRFYDWLSGIGSEPRVREFTESFLRRVDTGIEGLAVRTMERNREEWLGSSEAARRVFENGPDLRHEFREVRGSPGAPTVVDRALVSRHVTDSRTVEFDVYDESDGTRQLLRLLPIVAGAGDPGGLHLIDELDGSLHPTVCVELLRSFAEECPDPSRQMIVTTHEAHLLDADLLRRDEYWFVEKDLRGQTTLSSLSEFDIPDNFPVRRGYLQGRFGGIPRLSSAEPSDEEVANPPCSPRGGSDAS